MKKNSIKETIANNSSKGINRRKFMRNTAFVGGSAVLLAKTNSLNWLLNSAQANSIKAEMEYELAKQENIIYSTCLQCHVACPIKCKTWDGVLAKIDGSPYSPQNMIPHKDYSTPLSDAALADGKLCAKGQSGIQTYGDPYRIRKVLKRKGARGSNKWETIEWDQFINDVIKGGKLFSDIGDDRHYPGFEEVFALRDPAISKSMASDVSKIKAKEMSVEEFKTKHADNLDKLIDPNHPDLGPINNEFIFNSGRMEHGRKEMRKFFTKNCFGSINQFDHYSICEESHHVAYSEMTHHKTHHLKVDLLNAEFVIFWGTGAFSANFGLTPMAEKVTSSMVGRGMKTAVIDPRLSNDASKANWWLPIKPGEDGALAMAMIRWIIENERYDKAFLTNSNKAAAKADNETCWSNATHLVRIIDGHPQKLLRASEVGLGSENDFVVSIGGALEAVSPENSDKVVEGDLFVDTVLNGEQVKSSFQLLKEESFKYSLANYSKITGIPVRQIIEVAREFTSHGKKSAIDFYRGPCQHSDGYYASTVIIALNIMVGNPDWKGGLTKGGSHWHEFGGKPGNIYNTITKPYGGFKQFGITVSRESSGEYEESTLFERDGYPAKRPWYPLASGVYQEILPSQAQGYPYKAKIMLLHKGTPALAIPGSGYTDIETLANPDKLPLFIACDIVIGETSMYADYIMPDLTYLERWGTPHVTPDVPTMTSKVRQPVAFPLTEEVTVDGEVMPISLEAFLIAIGKKLGLPGIGKDAFGIGLDFNRPEDFYLRAVANIAYGDKIGEVVPNASDEELEIFRKARKHLPKSVFDEQKWKKSVGELEWRKIVYVLNRGGRYDDFAKSYKGDKMYKQLKTQFNFFMEDIANMKNAMSGKYFHGIPVYIGQYDCRGKPLSHDESKYPFIPVTYKEPIGGHSRTISNYWSNIALNPENRVLINRVDAKRLGLKPKDMVRLVSPDNPKGQVDLQNGEVMDMVAGINIIEGILPGTLGISWHYGHWAYGSNDVLVDDQLIKGDKRRRGGIAPNPIIMRDPYLKDVSLTCPIGASASYYDSRCAIIKV